MVFNVSFSQGGNIPVNILPVTYAGHPHGHNNTLSPDDLPKVVVTTLAHGSPVMSIDFHPIQQIVLLGMSPMNVQILYCHFLLFILLILWIKGVENICYHVSWYNWW